MCGERSREREERMRLQEVAMCELGGAGAMVEWVEANKVPASKSSHAVH